MSCLQLYNYTWLCEVSVPPIYLVHISACDACIQKALEMTCKKPKKRKPVAYLQTSLPSIGLVSQWEKKIYRKRRNCEQCCRNVEHGSSLFCCFGCIETLWSINIIMTPQNGTRTAGWLCPSSLCNEQWCDVRMKLGPRPLLALIHLLKMFKVTAVT